MESQIKTSFIPKKPITQTVQGSSRMIHKSSGVDLMMLVSIVLLVVAGVLSAGVFLYKNISLRELDNKKTAIEQSKDSFQPELIKEFMQLSSRIQVAEGILENHIAPSVFLHALERDTLTGVQFTEFKLKPINTEVAEFSLKGKTGSVNSVALQSSRFGDSNIIKNSIFSDIDLVNGGVTFNVIGEINLDTIRFADMAQNLSQDHSQNLNNIRTNGLQQESVTGDDPLLGGEISEEDDGFGEFGSFE
ncbi:MAG: hypothetical protein LRZ97_01980 [Candidatus Pacebacteria bacterium]|nr:hypothetical protein [Candidatus Paceibacterota bacterium]